MKFADGVDDLKRIVGTGHLEGRVHVDQVYAAPQHEGFWRTGPNAGVIIRNHPRGGQAKFLEQPLMQKATVYVEDLAHHTLQKDGLHTAMRHAVDDLADRVHELAPRENDILRNSARAQVIDDGHVVYDRPPLFPRFTADELKLIKRGHATPHELKRRH